MRRKEKLMRKLRRWAFVVSDRSGVRLRTDGTVVGQKKWSVHSRVLDRGIRHAAESARLEGVSLDADFQAELIRRAAAKPTLGPAGGHDQSRAK